MIGYPIAVKRTHTSALTLMRVLTNNRINRGNAIMTASYFKHTVTVEQIKAEYRRLCKTHHPDLGGDLEVMKAVNQAYHAALKSCDKQTRKDASGREFTYRYNETVEQAVIDKIHELLSLRLNNVTIALMGTWLWITGDTKPFKEELKTRDCKWSPQKKAWYWHSGEYKRKHGRNYSLSEIASLHGYREFSETQKGLN